MAEDIKQKDFKAFEKAFNQIRRTNEEERRDAVGTLTPDLLKKHIKSGQTLVLAYGKKGETREYTLQDLKQFSQKLKQKERQFQQSEKGIPLALLEKNSRDEDRRKLSDIRNATLYQVQGNVLKFQVAASGKNPGKTHHHVRIRLEDWFLHMTSSRQYLSGARLASVGKLSIDCSCGRHQFWYRYLANIGNYDVTPPKESAFPKIRNPALTGCCCKHVLKVLQQLKSPSVHNILAKHMEKQAEKVGYTDKKEAKFLSKEDLVKSTRAIGSKEGKAALKAYSDYLRAEKAYRKKTEDKKVKKELDSLKAKESAQKEVIKKQKRVLTEKETENKQLKMDLLVKDLQIELLKGIHIEKREKDDIIVDFAKSKDMDPIDIQAIIEEYKL